MKLPAGLKEITIAGARRCDLEIDLADEELELFIKIMRIVKMNGVDFDVGKSTLLGYNPSRTSASTEVPEGFPAALAASPSCSQQLTRPLQTLIPDLR